MRKANRLSRYFSDEEPQVNLTPLIDVVFVVLILFIVIAPMINVDPIKLASSRRSESISIDEKKNITLRIYSDQTVSINQRLIPKEHMRRTLEDIHKKNPHMRALLLCDKAANFGTYQTVKETLEFVGFEEMDIAVSPDK